MASLSDQDALPLESTAGQRKPASVPPSTILLVEDDPMQLTLLCEYVRHAGCTPVIADGPTAALAALEADASIRLAFSDVRMPDKAGGIGFIRHMRQHWPNIPLVVLSAYEDDLIELRGTPEYPVLLIPKPIRRWQIEDALTLLLRPSPASYEAMPYGVLVFDGAGRFLSMNMAARRIAGHDDGTSDEASFSSITLIRQDGTRIPEEERCEWQVLATTGPVEGLIHGMLLPDGQRRWLSLTGVPVSDPMER